MNESKNKLSPPKEKKIIGSAPTKKEQKKELVILRGTTTSQINQALKADNPYPARVFLKVEGQEQDIPVFFRMINSEKAVDFKPWLTYSKEKSWLRPKIPTNSRIEVKGYFDNPKNGSNRKSFTAYSYQILAKVKNYE